MPRMHWPKVAAPPITNGCWKPSVVIKVAFGINGPANLTPCAIRGPNVPELPNQNPVLAASSFFSIGTDSKGGLVGPAFNIIPVEGDRTVVILSCPKEQEKAVTGPKLMGSMSWWRLFPPRPERCSPSIAIDARICSRSDWPWRPVARNTTLKKSAVTLVEFSSRKPVRYPTKRGTPITLCVGT
jgi:hypothetical protein